MALTITSGGSLTTALGLTLLAWGIRALRGAALRSILEDTSSRFQNLKGLNFLLSRLLLNRKYKNAKAVGISTDAFKFLVRERPVPFVVFEVARDDRRRGGRRGGERETTHENNNNDDNTEASASDRELNASSMSSADGDATDGSAAERRAGILGQVQCFPEHTLKELLIQSITLPRGLRSALSGGARGPPSTTPAAGEADQAGESRPPQPQALALKLSKTDLVVLVSESGDDIQQLASFTCDLGYRCVFLKGGIRALEAEPSGYGDNGGEASDGIGLSRDAIWALMYLCKTSELRTCKRNEDGGRGDDGTSSSVSSDNGAGSSKAGGVGSGFAGECRVFDVRRHDELALFGTFEGATHLSASLLPHGLHLTGEEWRKKFRCPKPSPAEDIVLLLCNDGTRAHWIARLFRDLGYERVFYARGGTNAWHLDATVWHYSSYQWGKGHVPDPQPFALEEVNFERGSAELARAGLL